MKVVNQYNRFGAEHQIPKTIIVHAMGEYLSSDSIGYDKAPDFLEKEGLSCHALVSPDGTIYRCRKDSQGAFHARDFNKDSLGIEIMVSGRHNWETFKQAISNHYTTAEQYAALVWQVKEWIRLYGITDIKRHSDVSPGRKIDPGEGFDWEKFLEDSK